MRRRVTAILLAGLFAAASLTGCGSSSADAEEKGADTAKAADAQDTADTAGDSSSGELETITVGAVPTPHAEILNYVKDDLKEKGYDLKVVEFDDYVLPNKALSDGELDANYFQHQPYLDNYNKENGTDIQSVTSIHFEPFGIYAGKTKSLDDLKDGAAVAVPNDPTNEARALLLLEANGLIEVDDNAGVDATVLDITSNPKNLKFSEIEAAQTARALQDVDIAAINGNYAIQAGLSVSDALALETKDSLAAQTYANVVAVRKEDVDSDKTKALVEVLHSDKVKKYIEDKFAPAVQPAF